MKTVTNNKKTITYNAEAGTLKIWPHNLRIDSESDTGLEHYFVPELQISDRNLSELPSNVSIIPYTWYNLDGIGITSYGLAVSITKISNNKARAGIINLMQEEADQAENLEYQKSKRNLILLHKVFNPEVYHEEEAAAAGQNQIKLEYSITVRRRRVNDIIVTAAEFDRSVKMMLKGKVDKNPNMYSE